MELSLCEAVSDVGPDEFAQLLGPESFPFLRYEWLHALEESGSVAPERGWIPRHMVIRRGPDVLAVVPAYLKLNSLGEFVFDQGWADFSENRLGLPYYPKLVLAVPFTPATGPRILFRKDLSEDDKSGIFDVLTGALPEVCEKLGLSSAHILFPDDKTGEELALRQWALRLGIQYQFQNPGYEDFEGFLGKFRSKKRAAIRRECREVEARFSIEVTTGETLRASDARLAYQLYLTTVDKHYYGRRYLTAGFFERVMRTMPDGIHLVLARDAAGEVVAGAFNLLGKEALYGRYWGAFQEVPFLHFYVCLYAGVRETIARKLPRFEPGAGGEHKESRGFSATLTRSYHYLKEPTLDVPVRDFCKRESEAILAHVREHQDQSTLSSPARKNPSQAR